jgi:hypothetical protein
LLLRTSNLAWRYREAQTDSAHTELQHRLQRQSSPGARPVFAAFVQARKAIKTGRTISARFRPVNWKMGKLTKDQALGGLVG